MFKKCDHCGIEYFLFHNCVVDKKEELVPIEIPVLKEEISVLKEEEITKPSDDAKQANEWINYCTTSVIIPHMHYSSSYCLNQELTHEDQFYRNYQNQVNRGMYERDLVRRKLKEENFPPDNQSIVGSKTFFT